MTSNSSKALPYLGLAIGIGVTAGTLLGYGDQIDKAIAALQALAPIIMPSSFAVTVGGLVNKALEVRKSLGQTKSLEEIRDVIKTELEKAKDGAPTA